jgi:hypothetical protein
MNQPDARERARLLLLHEAAGARDAAGLAAAAERVCMKLRDELTGLIGEGGVGALAGRALTLARQRHPHLNGVQTDPKACFHGLAAALDGTDAAEAEAAGATVIETFLGLMVSLVGEDLALRPVRKLWPEGASGDGRSDFHERAE